MRNLVLLLLLANLGVMAVFAWVIREPEPPEPYDGPTITLLRETERVRTVETDETRSPPVANPQSEDEEAEASSEPAEDAADSENVAALPAAEAGDPAAEETPPPPRCLSVGPFADEEQTEAAMATLVEAGFDPDPSIREAEVWDGYWVYIDRIESLSAAQDIVDSLDENGIEDTQIITGTDTGVRLSLGIFSEIARAGAQAERADQLGFEATISDSMRRTETHWLDVTLTSEESLALELLQAPGTISRLEQVDCSTEARR